jgi:hypothetical protein
MTALSAWSAPDILWNVRTVRVAGDSEAWQWQ